MTHTEHMPTRHERIGRLARLLQQGCNRVGQFVDARSSSPRRAACSCADSGCACVTARMITALNSSGNIAAIISNALPRSVAKPTPLSRLLSKPVGQRTSKC